VPEESAGPAGSWRKLTRINDAGCLLDTVELH